MKRTEPTGLAGSGCGNLGTLKTPQLAELHEDMWDIIDSNAEDGDKAKGAIAIDAFPGLGQDHCGLGVREEVPSGGDRRERPVHPRRA